MPQRKETGIVLRQEELTPGMFSIWSQTDIFRDAAAGQFAALYSNDSSRLLPRPFGICDVHRKEKDGEDAVRFVYRVAGAGTKEFSKLQPGDTIDVMGPLGNGFAMQDPGKRAILIAGGSGVPPIFHLAKRLNGDKTVVLGYRDSHMFLADECRNYAPVYIATEDGSAGTKGNVLDAIRENGIEADEPALAQFVYIFNMQHGETAGVLLEVVHGGLLPHHGPVDVHLPEHILRIGVLDEIFHPHLVLYLLKLMRVGVVAILQAGSFAATANLIGIVAQGLGVLQCLG